MTGLSVDETDEYVAAADHKQSANFLTTAADLQRVWEAGSGLSHR